MEIIDTIIHNGKSDLLLILFICLVFLLGFIIALKFLSHQVLFMSFVGVGFVSFGIFFIVTAFLPEQTEYKAIVTDYKAVQESGYMILEHLEDYTYLVKEVNER